MQKNSVINPIRIDLSDKTQDEIAEYLQAILAIRYSSQKKGFKFKINQRKLSVSRKITPA
jgi:hypothetical protein